jgi:hypothetical protein
VSPCKVGSSPTLRESELPNTLPFGGPLGSGALVKVRPKHPLLPRLEYIDEGIFSDSETLSLISL